MPRLEQIEPEEATGEAKEALQAVKDAKGAVPNILKGMANSPAALRAYMGMSKALDGAELSEAEQHIVFLVTSEVNGCEYCVAAHTMLARRAGLSDEEILGVRKRQPDRADHQALVDFTRAVIETRGFVSDAKLESFISAGYSEGQAAEVCAVIAQATFTNYFNHVNETELDFPEAPEL